MDFTPGSDKMVLALIDADAAKAGMQTPAYLGTAAFAGHGVGSARSEVMGSGAQAYVQVQVDVDGNATADLFIDLMGLSTPLMASDFGF